MGAIALATDTKVSRGAILPVALASARTHFLRPQEQALVVEHAII